MVSPLLWRFAPLLFLTAATATGMWLASHYGISWDEKAMFVLGEEAYEAVFRGETYPQHEGIRYHGAWFEMLLYGIPEMLSITYARHVFMLRHALTFLMFVAGMGAMILLGKRLLGSTAWGLLAATMLLLSPRLFGHAFINSRDIPAMTCFAFGMLATFRMLETRRMRDAALCGAVWGFTMALRIAIGGFLPILAALGLILHRDDRGVRGIQRSVLLLGTTMVCAALMTTALWPLLWDDPLRNGMEALRNMTRSQNQPGGFYLGTNIGMPPWHWIPVWMSVTTPSAYVLLLIMGTVTVLQKTVRRSVKTTELLTLLWVFLPWLTMVVLRAPLFDEWRHAYFLYPGMLLLGLFGLQEVWNLWPQIRWPRYAVVVGLTATFLHVTAWIATNHPLEYIYFSFPGRAIEGRFALDYWGLSYRHGFEWLLAHDDSPKITVHVTSSPGWENLNILTRQQRRRLVLKGSLEAKYILDNFRWKHYAHWFPPDDRIGVIRVGGMDILGIYRNPFWDPAWVNPEESMEDTDIQLRFDSENMM